jgi:hypothetical protein
LQSAGSNPSLGGLIASVGFKQTEITYVKHARAFGKSKWTLNKKLQAFVDAFVAFSFAPMRIMIYTGLIISIIGFLYAIIIIILRLFFIKQIDGWSSIMVAVLFIGGIQMLMIGTLGEYLWRNLEESRKKPLCALSRKNLILNNELCYNYILLRHVCIVKQRRCFHNKKPATNCSFGIYTVLYSNPSKCKSDWRFLFDFCVGISFIQSSFSWEIFINRTHV